MHEETDQNVYMRLANGSITGAWLLQGIRAAYERPKWIAASRETWAERTGLTICQTRDAMRLLVFTGAIERKQAFVPELKATSLHVRPSRKMLDAFMRHELKLEEA